MGLQNWCMGLFLPRCRTDVHTGSSSGLKPDCFPWWEGLCSPSPCLEVQGLKRCENSDCQWKQGKINCWVPQLSPCFLSLNFLAYLLAGKGREGMWVAHTFFSLFLPMHLWKLILWFFTSPAKFSSRCSPAFLIPSLHIWVLSLDSSQNACPCFHYLCISSLRFSSTRREGCYLPDFLHWPHPPLEQTAYSRHKPWSFLCWFVWDDDNRVRKGHTAYTVYPPYYLCGWRTAELMSRKDNRAEGRGPRQLG